jgi:hypothetical protein
MASSAAHRSFRRLLNEHKTDQALNLINRPPPHLTQPSNELNLLQIAAIEGNNEIVLTILSKGIPADLSQTPATRHGKDEATTSYPDYEKPPLLLALERGHWITAQILLACGANKEKTLSLLASTPDCEAFRTLQNLDLDRHIFSAIIGWSIMRGQDNTLLQKMKKRIDIDSDVETHEAEEKQQRAYLLINMEESTLSLEDMSAELNGYLELATDRKCSALASTLWDINQQHINLDNCTGAFAVYHENTDLLNKIKTKNAWIAATLSQLETLGYHRLFVEYYASLNRDQQDFYDTYRPTSVSCELSAIEKQILLAAKKGYSLEKVLNTAPKNHCYAVLDYAMRHHAYAALYALIRELGNEATLRYAIEKNNRPLFFTVLFNAGKYHYELASPTAEMLSLIHPLEARGIAYSMISHGASNSHHDCRTPAAIATQENYFHDRALSTDQFIELLFIAKFSRFDIRSFSAISQNAPRAISSNHLITLMQRFEIKIPYDQISSMPSHSLSPFEKTFAVTQKGLWLTLSPFFTMRDKQAVRSASRQLYSRDTDKKLQIVVQFLQDLDHELSSQSCWQHREWAVPASALITFSLGVIGLIISSALFIRSEGSARSIKDEMRNYNYTWLGNNHHCDDSIASIGIECAENTESIRKRDDHCVDLCKQLFDSGWPMIPEALLTIYLSLWVIAALGNVLDDMPKLFAGKNRFNEIALQDISPTLYLEANRILAEIAPNLADRLQHGSTISHVRKTFEEIRERLSSTTNGQYHTETRDESISISPPPSPRVSF